MEGVRSAENAHASAMCSAALLVDGHVALLATGPVLPSAAGVTAQDDLDTDAATGGVPTGQSAAAPNGSGAGALLFKLTLAVSLLTADRFSRTPSDGVAGCLANRKVNAERFSPGLNVRYCRLSWSFVGTSKHLLVVGCVKARVLIAHQPVTSD